MNPNKLSEIKLIYDEACGSNWLANDLGWLGFCGESFRSWWTVPEDVGEIVVVASNTELPECVRIVDVQLPKDGRCFVVTDYGRVEVFRETAKMAKEWLKNGLNYVRVEYEE